MDGGPAAVLTLNLWLVEETSRYVYRIFAIKQIFENPYKYGFGNSEHDAGCCADEPLLRPNGKVTDESVDRRDLLRRLLHLNRTDAPVDEALLHGLRLADDTEGLELQDGG